MAPKVLALIENNIGTKLLLATRLTTIGYQITLLSAPVAFRQQVEADSFDWIIIDDAALPPVRRRFLDHLQRHRGEARIVWCGKSPRWTSVPIEATFDKPLRYNDIGRFFSARISRDLPGERRTEAAIPSNRAGKPQGPFYSGEKADRKTPGETAGADGTREGDGKR